jgi:two-component system CheB/CheR fusion protein
MFDNRSGIAPAVYAPVTLPESEKDRRLNQLEREVEALRNYMRAATEEHGAIQEELRSAHEEVLSANEELQSANEELESSKEELQSTNEELLSTIDELRARNQQLAGLNTELAWARLASERARAYADIIIETVREPLVVIDANQRIHRVYPAFLEKLQISREQAEGRFLHEIDAGRWNIPALREKLDELRTRASPMDDFEVTVELASRHRRVLSFSARAIPGNADRVELYLLAVEDVTVRANVAAGLLADSVRKDEFLATLGHELRHPLTPITHSAYLLRQRTSDPSSLELLDAIDSETGRLKRFVDELLDVARIGRGLIEIRRSKVDFGAVVREAIQRFQSFIEERRLTLSLVIPAAPIYVNGDADRLNQVVTNLVENAAKYTDPGGKITVSLERRADQAVLSVRDSGIGIAAENLELIFAPYAQTRGVITDPRRGLGLGLGVVRRILELHGGSIRATSGGPMKGSEFFASIPALGVDEPHDAEPQRPSTRTAQVRRRRILIVDDQEPIRKSLTRLFKAWDHEVAVAEDGDQALARAQEFKPNYAVIDITLPGMSGIDLAQRLRAIFSPKQLFLIALTGRGGGEMRAECIAAGFDAFLVKPGEISEFRELFSRDHELSDET